jgi:hypothetical protein
MIRDVYPIPQITHILEQLQGKTLFTALDIRWGYNACAALALLLKF